MILKSEQTGIPEKPEIKMYGDQHEAFIEGNFCQLYWSITFISDFEDLPIKRVLSINVMNPEQCIDSDLSTTCKSSADERQHPSAIKLELKDSSFNYLIRSVTIWRPFPSAFHPNDPIHQEQGQRFEVEE